MLWRNWKADFSSFSLWCEWMKLWSAALYVVLPCVEQWFKYWSTYSTFHYVQTHVCCQIKMRHLCVNYRRISIDQNLLYCIRGFMKHPISTKGNVLLLDLSVFTWQQQHVFGLVAYGLVQVCLKNGEWWLRRWQKMYQIKVTKSKSYFFPHKGTCQVST